MREILVLLVLACAALPLAACDLVGGGGQPEILTTTTIFSDMAKQVVGDRMKVGSIVPTGVHVEEYEPTPDDAKRVTGAEQEG